MADDNGPLFDRSTARQLDDDHALGWVTYSDGIQWPIIAVERYFLPGAQRPVMGCAEPECAPHEQTGRLPAEVRRRLWPCKGATRSGSPCKNPADVGTTACYQHRGRVTHEQ